VATNKQDFVRPRWSFHLPFHFGSLVGRHLCLPVSWQLKMYLPALCHCGALIAPLALDQFRFEVA